MRRIVPTLVKVGLVLAVFGTVASLLVREERERAREWREQEARDAAAAKARGAEIAQAEFRDLWQRCRDEWREGLSVYVEPIAFAWTSTGIDAYVHEGVDPVSWRQLSCDAAGVRRGPRVEPPFGGLFPAEVDAVEAPPADDDGWSQAVAALANRGRDPLDRAVEMLRHPRTGEVIVRRWRGLEGGAEPVLEPADAPPFALLVAEPRFPFAEGSKPPRLRELVRHVWVDEPDAAFDRIARALPPGARISEITLDRDPDLEVQVAAPTKAFDGNPDVPWGELSFDEYGVAEQDWWYPREIPGFGCREGAPLTEVRAAFAEARERKPGRLLRAWWSCSPAYARGDRGTWNLVRVDEPSSD